MYESGLVEIQPHSYDLHHYRENSKHGKGILPISQENKKDHYNRFLKDTKEVMKHINDNIGCESYVFSYPYGKYVSTNEEVLKTLNFKVILTTKSEYADISNGLYGLKRINVPSHKRLEDLLLY
ncbi:polysaccharide deacetylase family protein [Tissierella sp. MSJ-40]|uniref:Polysaccharide deacetylase family protein n=1 Tax=Tissierella simiarum TaxID=2841534 RepID=A0ABS6E0U6_9FIRM|nr:polysaccharide deacetylase family protein [Tissierella simiarum]